MVKYYAGIGSRKTPDHILLAMQLFAQRLDMMGYILRSGGAQGADTAFASVVKPDRKEIFREGDATMNAVALAKQHHPAWLRLTPLDQRRHGRNVMIILGRDLKSPVEFVVCWTQDGKMVGGTAMGIRVAKANNIPVYNLADGKNLNTFHNMFLLNAYE